MTDRQYPLSPIFREKLAELIVSLPYLKTRGGFIVLSVTGPRAKDAVVAELQKGLKDQFQFKRVQWDLRIRDLIELFPASDAANTLYLVGNLEQALQEKETATYSLLIYQREFYGKNKRAVVYMLPEDFVYKGLIFKAADFWTFRAGSYHFFMDEDYTDIIKEKVTQELLWREKKSDELALLLEFLKSEEERQTPDQKRIADLLLGVGNAYLYLGKFPDALKTSQNALTFFKQSGDKRREVLELSIIGTIYYFTGQLQKSLALFNEVLDLFRQLGDKLGEAFLLSRMGLIFCDLNQPQKALETLQQGLALAKQLGDKCSESANLIGIGLVYNSLNEPQKTIPYLQHALKLFVQLGDKGGEAVELGRIGETYRQMGETQKALTYLLHSLELIRQLELDYQKPQILHSLGLVYLDLGEKEKALDYLHEALEIYKSIGHKQKEETILKSIEQIK